MTELSLARFLRPNTWPVLVISASFLGGHLSVAGQTALTTPPGAAVISPNAGSAPAAPTEKSSAWRQLTPMQRQALAPLGAQWSALTPQQQNKWLTISKNFTQLPVADQITMHSRMADWVDLSPQQRNLARLNFNQLQSLPKEDKKAKWEAYQALSPEAKQKLAAQQNQPIQGAAPAIKPVSAAKLTASPVANANKQLPRIATDQVAPATLLPNPVTSSAPASVSTESAVTPQ
jgi:hypothetical protein